MAQSDRELLLSCLDKIGTRYRGDVLKDKRAWDSTGAPRCVDTWREAHRILIELESLEEGTRSFHAAIGPASQEVGGGRSRANGHGRNGGHWDGTMMAPTIRRAADALGICFRKRDQGDCDRADCPYNHEDKAIAAARAEKAKQGKGGGLGKARPTPNAFSSLG